jgi:type II secretory pathway pseudopilin PulG
MNNPFRGSARGFSLIELMIATGVLMIVSSMVTSGLLQMTRGQQTLNNRTQMHSGVRSATELLQQEIGQAGRITVPTPITLAVVAVQNSPTVTLSSVDGLFEGELLLIAGKTSETVQITNIDTGAKKITVVHVSSNGITTNNLQASHSLGAAVIPVGGFGTGVVPPAPPLGTYVNGSSGSVLKLYGDINGDGNLVYVEYVCDTTSTYSLYRNMMPWTSAVKPPLTVENTLLTNIQANPPQTAGGPNLPCFQYQMNMSGTYVLDVAVTLTVKSQQIDAITKKSQLETKALLNISPRNVISTWQAAGGNQNRVQPMPSNISQKLLP